RAGGSQPARWPLLPARTRLVLQGWQVAAACALVVVLAWAGPWLSWWSGRKPPGWAASAETCERALAGRIPAETTEVVSRAIGKIRARGGRRWHGAHVYLSRCTSTGRAELRQMKTEPCYYTLTNRWGGKAAMRHINTGVLASPFMCAALVIDV